MPVRVIPIVVASLLSMPVTQGQTIEERQHNADLVRADAGTDVVIEKGAALDKGVTVGMLIAVVDYIHSKGFECYAIGGVSISRSGFAVSCDAGRYAYTMAPPPSGGPWIVTKM
jgi:hypothetical protein